MMIWMMIWMMCGNHGFPDTTCLIYAVTIAAQAFPELLETPCDTTTTATTATVSTVNITDGGSTAEQQSTSTSTSTPTYCPTTPTATESTIFGEHAPSSPSSTLLGDDDEFDDDEQDFVVPTEEREIEPNDIVSATEIAANSEFFSSNPVKTRGRYVKIRNHILRCWQKQRPKYVSKTSVRPGLKVCCVDCIALHCADCWIGSSGLWRRQCYRTSSWVFGTIWSHQLWLCNTPNVEA
jgi:hypothetical protein